MRVLIIGAGGHAQVVADILLRMRDAGSSLTPVGYLDDNPALVHKSLLDLPVLGSIASLSTTAHDALIVAIGENEIRSRIFQMLQTQGECFAIARHPQAVIAPDVALGPGSMICAGVVVNTGTTIGENVILNTGCTVDHHNRIGDHVHIAPGVHMGGDVTIDKGTLVGIGAVVMPGRRIGSWAVVGAGALVQEDVPDGSVVVGVPARRIG